MKIAKLEVSLGLNDAIIFSFWIGFQRYILDRIENDHLVWTTHCPECGNKFETTSPHQFTSINRRCQFHRRAGARVRNTSFCRDGAERDNLGEPLA